MSSTTNTDSKPGTNSVFLKLASFGWLRLAMVVLVITGIGVSTYLLWGYTVPGAELSCGGSHGCETVKNSPYANVVGVPIPIIGLASYLTLLFLLLAQEIPFVSEKGWSPYVALAVFAFALIGVLFSAYLTYLELFVIFAICRWCVASAIILMTLLLLSIFNLRHSNQAE
ncbi:MAG TPA: vitamin K epoxide reductase family protein [Anaerolineae bacterium]|nr:vitamin K epoxide reductase family protein [Anaerolineae bacterium]